MVKQEDNKTKIILFGQNGQVAKALINQLSKEQAFYVKSYSSQDIDFNNPERLESFLEKVELNTNYIVNATAYTNVDKAEEEKELADNINNKSVAVLAKFCAKNNIPLIHYSTDYVFSGLGDEPFLESDLDSLHPLNIYGTTKLAGENSIINSGCNYLIFRTSWVWSVDGKNFVNTIRRLSSSHETLKIISDQVGSPTFAGDIAKHTIEVIKWIGGNKNPFPNGIYHLTNDGYTSWHEFTLEIIKALKKNNEPIKVECVEKISSSEYKTIAARPLNSRLNLSKIKEKFNLKIRNWKETLSELNNA